MNETLANLQLLLLSPLASIGAALLLSQVIGVALHKRGLPKLYGAVIAGLLLGTSGLALVDAPLLSQFQELFNAASALVLFEVGRKMDLSWLWRSRRQGVALLAGCLLRGFGSFAVLLAAGVAMAQQRRFVADAAHELRSPLTAMSLQAERLAAADMSDEARQRMEALAAGLQRTRVLLDQLLALARSQEQQREAMPASSLQAAVRTVLEDIYPLAEAKNIDLGVVGTDDGDIGAELLDLKVLVKNLVDNAIRYTPAGGQVDIAIARAGQWVDLVVDDTGPGIPQAEAERVFDPFYRVLGNGGSGSGLGLAIVRTIANKLGANVALGSAHADRSGLRVVVRFPVRPPAPYEAGLQDGSGALSSS